jgi:hypothetical protein
MMSTPLESIHKFCGACAGSPFEVKTCGGDKCMNGDCRPGSAGFLNFAWAKGAHRSS